MDCFIVGFIVAMKIINIVHVDSTLVQLSFGIEHTIIDYCNSTKISLVLETILEVSINLVARLEMIRNCPVQIGFNEYFPNSIIPTITKLMNSRVRYNHSFHCHQH
jgi:hypothetical protein